MIYTCTQCHFTFHRTSTVETCPDCGKADLREATDKEKNEYKKNYAEYEKTEAQKSRK